MRVLCKEETNQPTEFLFENFSFWKFWEFSRAYDLIVRASIKLKVTSIQHKELNVKLNGKLKLWYSR